MVLLNPNVVTNSITCLEFVTPLVCSHCQADAIYFDLSCASDLLPHDLLLHNLANYGLSAAYVNWFQLPTQQSASCPLFWSSVIAF
jgi:hypothetical protein